MKKHDRRMPVCKDRIEPGHIVSIQGEVDQRDPSLADYA